MLAIRWEESISIGVDCIMSVQSKGAEAIFSWQGPHVAGRVHIDEDTYTLEGCGEQCFLWIKQSSSLKYDMSSATVTRYGGRPYSQIDYAKLRVITQ